MKMESKYYGKCRVKGCNEIANKREPYNQLCNKHFWAFNDYEIYNQIIDEIKTSQK
jgi:hypothetical protein